MICQRKGKLIKVADVLDGISVELGRGSNRVCMGLSLHLFWVCEHVIWEMPARRALEFIHVETKLSIPGVCQTEGGPELPSGKPAVGPAQGSEANPPLSSRLLFQTRVVTA